MLSKSGLVYLAITIFGWGLTWPVNKVLLTELSPFWMLSLRSAIASISFFALTAASRRLSIPPRNDIPILISITLLHMIGFASLAALGLTLVSTGRAVVLAYTTPLWVVPGAALFLNERMTVRKIIGVTLGICGLLILFSPTVFNWHDSKAVFGNYALLVAAFFWAVSILHIRGHRWQSTPFDLAPWETLVATVILSTLALLFSTLDGVNWNLELFSLLVFSGLFGTAAPYWAVAMASRSLPAVTTSLGLLCTPLISIVTATVALGEPLTVSLLTATTLIIGGIIVGTTSIKSRTQ